MGKAKRFSWGVVLFIFCGKVLSADEDLEMFSTDPRYSEYKGHVEDEKDLLLFSSFQSSYFSETSPDGVDLLAFDRDPNAELNKEEIRETTDLLSSSPSSLFPVIPPLILRKIPTAFLCILGQDRRNGSSKIFVYSPAQTSLIATKLFDQGEVHSVLKPCVTGSGQVVMPLATVNKSSAFGEFTTDFIVFDPFTKNGVSKPVTVNSYFEYTDVQPLFNSVLLENRSPQGRFIYDLNLKSGYCTQLLELSQQCFYQTNPHEGQIYYVDNQNGFISFGMYATQTDFSFKYRCDWDIVEFVPKIFRLSQVEALYIGIDVYKKHRLFIFNFANEKYIQLNMKNFDLIHEAFLSSRNLIMHVGYSCDTFRECNRLISVDLLNLHSMVLDNFGNAEKIIHHNDELFGLVTTNSSSTYKCTHINLVNGENSISSFHKDGNLLHIREHLFFVKSGEEGRTQINHLDLLTRKEKEMDVMGVYSILSYTPYSEIGAFMRELELTPRDLRPIVPTLFDEAKELERSRHIDVISALLDKNESTEELLQDFETLRNATHFMSAFLSWMDPDLDKVD